jgi:hypothetical protein
MVKMENRVYKVYRVYRAYEVYLEIKVYKVILVRQEQMELEAWMEKMDLEVLQEALAFVDHKETRVSRVNEVQLALEV